MYDVVAIGELLIDFTENGLSNQGNPLLEANPGGAPCNVLSMLQRLGHSTAFIGKVGDDGFGNMLKDAIEEQGISSTGLLMDKDVHTTLAIVTKTKSGDRDFSFYRKPGADMMLKEDEIDEELIKDAKIFHLGTLSFTDEPVRSASIKALKIAKDNHKIITFDPNLREPLWNSLDEAKKWIDYVMKYADVLKISDNEITWFTGKDDYDEAIDVLKSNYPNLKLICLSLGPDGSRAYYKDIFVEQKAFLQEGPVETTGCGDTFMGNVIHYVLTVGLDNFNENNLKEMLKFANGAASLVSKRKGALRVMPTKKEVEDFLKDK